MIERWNADVLQRSSVRAFIEIRIQAWQKQTEKMFRVLENKIQTQSRIESAKKSNKYWQLTPRSTRMQTMERRSIDVRCNRFSWVKGNPDPRYSHRSLSVKEAIRIQGHSKIPTRLSATEGLSRSSCFVAIGNAWHIGAAVQVLKQLPIEGLLEFK